MIWVETIRIGVVCGLIALALLFVEALIRFRSDYLTWNGGVCPETGEEWRQRKRSDGKIELSSGDVLRVIDGWILPFEPDCF